VAAVAVVVVQFSAGTLLFVEAEFGVGFAALSLAPGEGKQGDRDRENP
jgi:hypothetical protein